VVTALRAAGVTTLYKKIDSTLRGHIAGELAATLSAWEPEGIGIVAPAFPRVGRTMVDGILCVDGCPAPGPTLKEILDVAGMAVASASLDVVRAGRMATLLREPRAGDDRLRAIVCDAETDADLDAIARAGVTAGARAVWVGSGGLAPALAAHLPSPSPFLAAPRAALSVPGPVLTVVGSWSRIAAEQVRHLQSAGARLCVFPLHALDGREPVEAGRRVSEIMDFLRHAEDVVVTLPGVDEPIPSGGDPRLTDALGVLLRPAADLAGGLILTGGDTAAGVLRAWGVHVLRLVGEVDAGMPLSLGSGAREIPVVTKPGAFGHPESLVVARDRLRGLRPEAEGLVSRKP
jgi:4-hydroxythreonine-4-phosphate dehydrogenase